MKLYTLINFVKNYPIGSKYKIVNNNGFVEGDISEFNESNVFYMSRVKSSKWIQDESGEWVYVIILEMEESKMDIDFISASEARSIMDEARKMPSMFELYKKKIATAITDACKHSQGDVKVETNGELTAKERNMINELLAAKNFKVKWHDIGDYDDEYVHIMWEEKFYV